MSEPDKAILWARERAARWQDESGGEAGPSYRSGKLDFLLGEEVEGYRAGRAASAERIKALEEAGDLLAWLAKHPEIELSWGDVGDVSECLWRVHVRHGGINDREWRLVDVGHTPTEAITNALALLKEADQ